MPEISDIVRITSSVIPRGELRKTFGVTLFVTTDDSVLDATGAGRMRTYTTLTAVAGDFATESEPYLAAQRYFSQEPFPKALTIARWAKADEPSEIRGGGTLANSPPNSGNADVRVNNGSLRILGTNITGINTTNDNSWSMLATELTSAINGAVAGTDITVQYNSGERRLEIQDAAYRDLSGLVTTITSGTVGTDLSGLLNLDSGSGATAILGSARTSIGAALTAIEDLDSGFYFVTLEKGENDAASSEALDEWVAGTGSYHAVLESNSADVLVTGETASQAYAISQNQSSRTNLSWSGADEYLALSVAARLSAVNLNGANSLITLNLKQMPGVDPDINLSASQIAELTRKNINYYTQYGTSNAYRDGRNLRPGIWTDVQYFLDWFTNAVQTAAFNALYSSNRIPQTPAGIAVIRDSIIGVCRNAVRNGGIARGTVSAPTRADIIAATNNEDFDGVLANGYLVYIAPISSQTQTERASRASPAARVWLKGSGAIHEIEIDIRFEN